jgi:hypothetical protein
MNRPQWKKAFLTVLATAGLATLSTVCLAADEPKGAVMSEPKADSSLYLKVQLPAALKMSKVQPGNVVEGKLVRDVYSADRELFHAGSQVQLTVDHLEKRRRARNDHWPWVVNVFTPRHESYPVFKEAKVSYAGGESTLQVSVLSVSRKRSVQALTKKKQLGHTGDEGAVEVSKSGGGQSTAPVMVLEASEISDSGLQDSHTVTENSSEAETDGKSTFDSPILPAGMRCKILLLGDVSASKSRAGDAIQARLLEPVFLNSKVVLPAGSLFEGKVVKETPPRWLSRAGSLYLAFTGLTLPDGNQFPIAATLAGAELDRSSHTRMDAEGHLHGERPGKVWMAINLGVTAGISKEVDDGVQLIVEAIVSTATDASTAGTSRIVASCVSGLYMVTRHGRDVVLPRFTEMDISLDRAVSLKSITRGDAVAAVAGGK